MVRGCLLRVVLAQSFKAAAMVSIPKRTFKMYPAVQILFLRSSVGIFICVAVFERIAILIDPGRVPVDDLSVIAGVVDCLLDRA